MSDFGVRAQEVRGQHGVVGWSSGPEHASASPKWTGPDWGAEPETWG